jgi:FKBP-type peptidyl-prolyl cis-trans isomerase
MINPAPSHPRSSVRSRTARSDIAALVRGALAVAAAAQLAALVACKSGDVENKGTSAAGTGQAAKPASATPAAATPQVVAPDPKALPAPADVAAPPANAEHTASGLASLVLQPGTGKDHPTARDTVKVHYTGWTKDGKMFDSSVVRGEPIDFPLNQVIKGWTEGVQLMVVGEKRRFWIPGALAYGDTARGGAPSGQLTFDVELLGIVKAPEPPQVPKDVAAPPTSAKKTASGLRYAVLTPGTGKEHPGPQNRVKVQYSGWTPDGKMFDSSVTRGRPATFGVTQVIKGWTEGLQLMVVGEKARFWIPSDLAYGESPRPGAPAGPLVFDVELLEIQ